MTYHTDFIHWCQDDENFELSCDACGENIIREGNHALDISRSHALSKTLNFCALCYGAIPEISLPSLNIMFYDRLDIEENSLPRQWKCFFCDVALGGRVQWLLYDFNQTVYLDVCLGCAGENPRQWKTRFLTLVKDKIVLRADPNLVHISHKVILDLSAGAEENNFNPVKDFCDADTLEAFEWGIHNVVKFPTPEEVGSLQNWQPFCHDDVLYMYCGAGARRGSLIIFNDVLAQVAPIKDIFTKKGI